MTCTGTKASTVGAYQPFRYRGYIYDFESGLYYLRSRYYNPTWGRFINADTNIGSVKDITQHNIYTYCHNSPIIFIDASGRECYFCDTGVATSYESFILSRAEVSVFVAWLDQQYPQGKTKTPFEQVVSNLTGVSSDQSIEYVSSNIDMIIVAFVIERRETEELSTGQESYIDWDSVIAVPWEELVINQTVNAQETILSKHIYFFCDGEIVKKLRIPSNIIFVAGEDKPEPIRVLRARKNMYLYEYLGERFLHLCELPEDIVGRSCLPSSKLTVKLYLIKPYY